MAGLYCHRKLKCIVKLSKEADCVDLIITPKGTETYTEQRVIHSVNTQDTVVVFNWDVPKGLLGDLEIAVWKWPLCWRSEYINVTCNDSNSGYSKPASGEHPKPVRSGQH